jgi:hypothetical protein
MSRVIRVAALAALLVTASAGVRGADEPAKGQRVFTCGHSFHVFMPRMLAEIAKLAKVKDHRHVGTSSLGGSRVEQHWKLTLGDDKFKSKASLESGNVDVLTLSPIYLPDDGIENFVTLAARHNPKVRVFIQENWLPFDNNDKIRKRPKEADHDKPTIAELKKMHEPYFKELEDHAQALNKKLGSETVFVAPVGQAVIALREKVLEGKVPGSKKQSDLFTDALGHVKPPVVVLSGYVYYSLIYRRSPVGLPVPGGLGKGEDAEKLNRLLQELAWEAVTKNPHSGVKEK